MKIYLTILLSLLLFPALSYAEDTGKIAAVVGGEVISTLDVRNRALMMVNSAPAAARTPDMTVETIAPQALQMLIDEKTYSQDAEQLHITVSPEEFNHAIASIEEKNRLQPGMFDQFLKERHIPVATVKEQVRAQIILAKIINSRIRPRVTVGEHEIEAEIAQLTNNDSEMHIKQIYVPLSEKESQEQSKKTLEHLRDKLNGCKTFDATVKAEAPSLSITMLSVTAASLNPSLRNIVASLPVGKISPLLEAGDNMQLLMVCERKQKVVPQQEKNKIIEMLSQKKVELQLKQYLRNLRQSTYVEIKM